MDKTSSCVSKGRLRLPEYLKMPLSNVNDSGSKKVKEILKKYNLNTVCDGARCPNKSKCYGMCTATFLIMGKYCTRNCKFCNISHRLPEKINPDEPYNVAYAIKELELKYAVITSVTRDDLPDCGAEHFAKTISNIKKIAPDVKIEVLTPDFKGCAQFISTVVKVSPDVFNHNIETVKRISHKIRPDADYNRSLDVLSTVKEMSPKIITKTGIMTGLGETYDEIEQTLLDIKKSDVDIVTIGQYIQPSLKHHPVEKYYTEKEFETLKILGEKIGIKAVISLPLARSSYMAFDTYKKIISKRLS